MIHLKPFPFILAGFVICALCLSGCITGDSSGTTTLKGDGFQDRTTAAVNDAFSLQDALNAFNESLMVTQPESSIEVLIIKGENLTPDGTASRWIIGYKEGTTNAFSTYDSTGQSFIPWRAWLPGTAIPIDRVMMPEEIFSRHSPEIVSLQDMVTGRVESLELRGTIYTLTTQKDGIIKNVRINAITGETAP